MRTAYIILLLHPMSGEYVSTREALGIFPTMTAAVIAASTYYPGIKSRIQAIKIKIAHGGSYAPAA